MPANGTPKHANRLAQYLESLDKSCGEELSNLKQQRKEVIVERLKELDWTAEDMKFSNPYAKPWRALVDAPKPLTERIWRNILPKLTLLLEENRERHISHGIMVRRLKRRRIVHEVLRKMLNTERPLEFIVSALGAELPPPPGPGGISSDLSDSSDSPDPDDFLRYFELGNPFPNTSLALTWDCLVDFDEEEIPVNELKAELEARTDQVRQKVQEWRVGIERQLAEQYESGVENAQENITVTVGGSTELTAHLSRDLRLLLRADTVFKEIRSLRPNIRSLLGLLSPEESPYFYPDLVSDRRELFVESEHLAEYRFRPAHDVELVSYRRDPEIERIIKELLWSLGMPDVTRIELQVLGARFTCGRCLDKRPKSWDRTVKHYIRVAKLWEILKDKQGKHPTRHPVVYQNVHDFEWTENTKPPVRLLTPEEATNSAKPPTSLRLTSPTCLPCEGTGRQVLHLEMADMLVHLQDVHDVEDPVRGIHYGNLDLGSPNPEWHQRWDWYYDAQESGSTPKWLPSSPSSDDF
ncbi:hypothetical protein FRC07_000018 [Ceratobasidium sp. 392]|nr:hypothetical protein FRC07_000018 [Ceratobasidium sp. 392]